MVRRIALLASLLLCHCGGCSGCGDHTGGAAPASAPAPDAAPHAAASTASVAPGAARPSASLASSAASAAADASMPAWPPQGPGCATFAACCEAAKPQPAARTVCMLSYNESRDCARATASFARKLKTLGAPIPDACSTPH